MSRVRLGTIGYGNTGSQHGRSMVARKILAVKLIAVADVNPNRLKTARDSFGEGLKTFDNAGSLIHSGCCDGVLIAVSRYYHPSIAIEAMEVGLHVLVEKPAGAYIRQVERMDAVAAKHPKLVYCMDFNQRTNPPYQKVKELLDSGELGQMGRVIWIITDQYRSQNYYDQDGWRVTWNGEGGGMLLNQNPHNLDLWQWMYRMPKWVKANVYYGKHRNIDVEDDVTALAKYENGATGCYITMVGDAPGTNRLEIDGERDKLVVKDGKSKFYRLRMPESRFNAPYKKGLGKSEIWECETPARGTYISHLGIINSFCDVVIKGTKPIALGEEGVRELQISNVAHLSPQLGGQWVDLSVDADLFLKKLQERCKEPVIPQINTEQIPNGIKIKKDWRLEWKKREKYSI